MAVGVRRNYMRIFRKKAFKTTILIAGIVLLSNIAHTVFRENYGFITGLTLYPQDRTQWCWAASTKMIAQYADTSLPELRQSNIVSDFKKKFNKSGVIDTSGCNKKSNLKGNIAIQPEEQIFYRWYLDSLGIQSNQLNTLISWISLKTEIDLKRPILLSGVICTECEGSQRFSQEKMWNNHVFVVVGYIETEHQRLLKIYDPYEACQGCIYLLNYDFLVQKNGINNQEITSICNIHKKYNSLESLTINLKKIWYGASNSLLSFWRDIKGNNGYGDSNNNTLITSSTNDLSIHTIDFAINELGFRSFKDCKIKNSIEVNTLSLKKLKANISGKTADIIEEPEQMIIVEVQNSEGESFEISVVRDRLKADFWIIKSITKCSWLKTPLLGKDSQKFVFLPQPIDMRFRYESKGNQTYWIPTEDYKLINNTQPNYSFLSYKEVDLYKEEAYKQEEIISYFKTYLNQ